MSAISDLANGEVTTRSYALCVAATMSYDDFTSGTGLPFCTLPIGAYILGGFVNVTTAWNSGTSDGMEIGTSADDNQILASVSVASIAKHHITLENAFDVASTEPDPVTAATDEVLIEVTSAGTAATAGVAQVVMLYVDVTKSDENYE